MPIVKNILRKGKNSYQGLHTFDVWREDNAPNSQYFNIFGLPEELPLGCSSFLIGGSELLKTEVELKIELLDSAGNVIYITPIDNYLEDKSRRISIEVYEDIAPGPATLTILGELNPNRVSGIPTNYQNVYNVKWSKLININKTKENDSQIKFYAQPTISVSEVVKGVVDKVGGPSSTTSTVTGTVALKMNTLLNLRDKSTDDELPFNDREEVGLEDFIASENVRTKRTTTFGNQTGKKQKKKKKRYYESVIKMTGNVVAMGSGVNNDTDKITSDFVGATITITNPHQLVDTDKYPSTRYTLPTTYSTKISRVINDTTFEVKTPYYITDDTLRRFPVSLKSATNNASIVYTTYVAETENSTFKRSFADITVGNLRTFSGDVYKAKIFSRESNTITDFEKIYDAFVVPPNELIDTTSATGFSNVGFFHTQSIIDNNWTSGSNPANNSTGNLAVTNDTYFIDGALISGSVRGIDEYVYLTTSQSFDLEKNVDYVVRFDSYFIKKTAEYRSDTDTISEEERAELKVYLSGSALSGADGELDHLLGSVEIPTNSNTEGEISSVVGSFRTPGSGSPKTWLKFQLNSGQFVIKDVSLEPWSETNFNPNYFRTVVPMPNLVRHGDSYDFRAEFYDVNNNEAEVGAIVDEVTFNGVPTVIQGHDNQISGSMLIGDSVEMYGTNPAYIRSVGYQGFEKTVGGSGDRDGGFLLWSGSIGLNGDGGNRITSSEAYNGVGLEIVDASSTNAYEHSFLQFASNYRNTGNSRFRVQTEEFLLGRSGSGAAEQYISGSEGKVEISSSNFYLSTDGSVTMAGTITAEAGGTIGGFTVGDSSLSAGTVFQLSSSQNTADPASFISSSAFKVSAGGAITGSNVLFTGGKIAGWNTSDYILQSVDTNGGVKFDSYNKEVTARTGSGVDTTIIALGRIGGSVADPQFGIEGLDTSGNLLFKLGEAGNEIAGWAISGSHISKAISGSTAYQDTTRVYMSSVNDNTKNITEGFSVYRKDEDTVDGGVKVVRVGGLSDTTNLHANDEYGIQVIKQSSATNYENLMYIGPTTQMIAGWNFDEKRLYSFTTSTTDKFGISLDANYQLITIHGDAGDGKNNIGDNDRDNVMIAIGQLTDDEFGLKGWDTSGNRVFELSTTRTEIAGWDISTSTISKNDLILDSAGIVQSTNYSPGLKGFRLSAEGNGFLEVENAKIRGTLRTTVFEKESVNAVGGQLQVSNATTITGSSQIAADATTIPVENVTGFTGSEVIMAKKIGATGYSTEYMLITSQSYQNSNSTTDFSGSLYVVRGYSGSASQSQASASLGDSPTPATTLEPGQVLVSAGFWNEATDDGSGYVRINANPNDSNTPFIDIVERTGSSIYDVDLKARLGDLGGISDTINGQAVSGFGLYTDNAFLKGGIVATYGSIGGFNMSSTDLWAGNATLGNSGTKIVIGDSDGTPKIALGGTANSITLTAGDGVFMNGTGHFRAGDADGERISFDGTNAIVSASTFLLGSRAAGKSFVSGSAGEIEISGSAFHLLTGNLTASNVDLSGQISASSGDISGLKIGSDGISQGTLYKISSSADTSDPVSFISSSAFKVSAGGQMTASNALIEGAITATSGEIGGWDITSDAISDLNASGKGIEIKSHASTPIITIKEDANNKLELWHTTGTNWGIKGISGSDTVFQLGHTNSIAGWVFDSGSFSKTSGDAGITLDAAKNNIIISGSSTDTTGNSVRLFGNAGVIEVSQSGTGVFDTGRTKTFTTTNIIEPDIFKPGARAFTTESITTTSLPSPTSENMFITSNLSVGNVLETDAFIIDTTSANTPFSIIQKVGRAADANLNDGASQPTASFAVVQENNFSGESSATNNNVHPGFIFQADYYTELETADNSIGWTQGSVTSGSNIFTIGTKLTSVEAADFEDAKFNILGLEANTAGISDTTKENQYTFLQAKHSSSIRVQIQNDGDIISAGNITAFGTSFLTVSDKNLKKDIYQISESLDKVLELRPTKFTWKETNKEDVGFIAQEVEKIIPEVIETSRGFINTDNDEERKTIAYPKLVPYLVDTIQQLTKRVEDLEERFVKK